jgi:hypothetical protein
MLRTHCVSSQTSAVDVAVCLGAGAEEPGRRSNSLIQVSEPRWHAISSPTNKRPRARDPVSAVTGWRGNSSLRIVLCQHSSAPEDVTDP